MGLEIEYLSIRGLDTVGILHNCNALNGDEVYPSLLLQVDTPDS